MSVRKREHAEEAAFQSRLKSARKQVGFTQVGMAKALGVKLDAYKKYENREGSVIPTLTLARFCEITGQDMYGLVTGRRFTSNFNRLSRKTG